MDHIISGKGTATLGALSRGFHGERLFGQRLQARAKMRGRDCRIFGESWLALITCCAGIPSCREEVALEDAGASIFTKLTEFDRPCRCANPLFGNEVCDHS